MLIFDHFFLEYIIKFIEIWDILQIFWMQIYTYMFSWFLVVVIAMFVILFKVWLNIFEGQSYVSWGSDRW
jgi:hypothetical protein